MQNKDFSFSILRLIIILEMFFFHCSNTVKIAFRNFVAAHKNALSVHQTLDVLSEMERELPFFPVSHFRNNVGWMTSRMLEILIYLLILSKICTCFFSSMIIRMARNLTCSSVHSYALISIIIIVKTKTLTNFNPRKNLNRGNSKVVQFGMK